MNPTSALSSRQTRAGHFCRRTWAFAQNPHKIIDGRCERSVNNSRLVGEPETIQRPASGRLRGRPQVLRMALMGLRSGLWRVLQRPAFFLDTPR